MVSDNYKWEAILPTGEILTKGKDLRDCKSFSLIPNKVGWLPRHDLIEVPLISRFLRGFYKVRFGDNVNVGPLTWEDGSRVVLTPTDLRDKISVGDLIQKKVIKEKDTWFKVLHISDNQIVLDKPYKGKTKFNESRRNTPKSPMDYLHCVICEHFRIYFRYSDGASFTVNKNYELYL